MKHLWEKAPLEWNMSEKGPHLSFGSNTKIMRATPNLKTSQVVL